MTNSSAQPFHLTSEPSASSTVRAPSATKRVLHVINGEHYSGAERVQDLLAGQLPGLGYDVGFAGVKLGKFANARVHQDVPLYETTMHGRFDLQVANRLAKLIRAEQYALVHAHTPRTALVGRLAAQRVGIPFVYHVHSPTGRDSTRKFQDWINSLVERWSACEAERLICVSPSLQQYIIDRGFEEDRVVCVPNGVPSVECSTRTIPSGDWTIGAVALFRPRKGLEILLQALAMLRSSGVNVRLRAVGPFETAEYESSIRQLVEQLDLHSAIDWVGFTTEVVRELKQMDLFVLPSLFGEGLPMVVLEAMAARLPIVATRVEGVPEAVVHRETGLLAEAGSTSQLAHAIEEIVRGKLDYTELSENAHARHAALFSDETMALGVRDVYRDVLSSR